MKRVFLIILSVIIVFLISGCKSDGVETPETNLEFWICDNADNIDFSECKQRYGIMGGREYYGSAYTPKTDENGMQADPEECVIYTVTAYPDYSSKTQCITRIRITDPSVTVYGLSTESSIEEIQTVMTGFGFKPVEGDNTYGIRLEKGKIRFHFADHCITISVNVSNKLGIQF